MYATISTAQLKPQGLAAFRQRWCTAIEPTINQLPALVDLYGLRLCSAQPFPPYRISTEVENAA